MSKEANSTKRALKLALEALENNRRTHYYCEDTWYSCPKHEEGCANESEGDECNCGADKANVEIDGAIIALREALAQDVPETNFGNTALDKKAENARELGLDYEPVCNKDPQGCWNVRCQLGKKCKNTSAQQEPVAWMTKTGSVWKTKADETDTPLYTKDQL
jgi:hypothetical protein